VLNLGYKPSEFVSFSTEEKAFVIACIENKIDAEKKQQAEMKAKTRQKGG